MFLMLLVRGVLLWLVIPASAVWWLLAAPIRRLRGKRLVGLGQTIGWADLNLIAVLTLGRSPFVPWSRVLEVEHRVGLADPA